MTLYCLFVLFICILYLYSLFVLFDSIFFVVHCALFIKTLKIIKIIKRINKYNTTIYKMIFNSFNSFNSFNLLIILCIGLMILYILYILYKGFRFTEPFSKNENNENEKNDNKNNEKNDDSANKIGMAFAHDNQYDNYNHYNKTSKPSVFYGPNGMTCKILNRHEMMTVSKNGTTETFYLSSDTSDSSDKQYVSPNGNIIKRIGNRLQLSNVDGSVVLFTCKKTPLFDNDIREDTFSPDEDNINNIHNIHDINTSSTGLNADANNSMYMNSLPRGIARNQIPVGDEDLYILKSQIVPPICPAPTVIYQPSQSQEFDASKCPPCPPCSRCPEPSFECAKVPNYNAFNPDTMPVPVLNQFTGFGM